MGLLVILIHALPDAPAMLHGNALGGKQNLLFTDVGKMIQDVGISPLKQFGVYEKSITAINISQCPAVAVGFLSVVNQPEFPAVDQFAIHRLGLHAHRFGPLVFMIDFRGIDTNITHVSAVVQNDGIPIGHPLGHDP